MNKLAEFFQGPNGELSATRLAFLTWIFVVLAGWGVDTARHDYKMAQIPDSVLTLVGVLMTGKAVQRFGEKPPSDSVEVEVKETVKATGAGNTALPPPGKAGQNLGSRAIDLDSPDPNLPTPLPLET